MRALMAGLVGIAAAVGMSCGPERDAGVREATVNETTVNETAVSETAGETAPETSNAAGWVEEDVEFAFGVEMLHGVVTRPTDDASHPAVVLVAGSGGAPGDPEGVLTPWFIDHSHRLALEGFAVLRYDPPGVGQSTGRRGLPSLEVRTAETAAAVSYLRTSPVVDADRVGLLGVSQGGWVIAMVAAQYPDEVAFVISVVGSGQSVAEQQVYGIQAQSAAAGLSDDDVTKAVLFGRLLIDWQLTEPMFHDVNVADADALGAGPWTNLMAIVYDVGETDPVEALGAGIRIMESVQDEPWAEALYLRDLYIPQFESIPADITPEQLAVVQAAVSETLTLDPSDALTELRAPVLAFFGADDVVVDSRTSAERYRQYLADAGNDDVTIVVLPDVGHGITIATPGYWNTLSDWLVTRFIG